MYLLFTCFINLSKEFAIDISTDCTRMLVKLHFTAYSADVSLNACLTQYIPPKRL
jgi:hypothetical protein